MSEPGEVDEVDTRRRRPRGAVSELAAAEGRLNPFTGTPAVVQVDDRAGASARRGQQPAAGVSGRRGQQPAAGVSGVGASGAAAVDAIEAAAPALGLARDQVEFVPQPEVVRTSTGAAVVHLQQHHLGIPVYDMVRTVVFGADGRVRRIIGENHAYSSPLGSPAPDAAMPAISAVEAGARAARHLAGDDRSSPLRDWEPTVVSTFALAARPTVLDRGPFERAVPAHLVFFGWELGDTRLAWRLVFDLPTGQYVVIVDARDDPFTGEPAGAVRYCRRTTHDLGAVRARVYPQHPGAGGPDEVSLPPPPQHYRLPVPEDASAFPRPWCLGPDTDGNFARVTDAANRPLAGRVEGSAIVFECDDPVGSAQCIVNAFYVCSLAHDLFLLLGFDEVSRNFEMVGSGTGGIDGDPVVVRIHDDAERGEAHMTCRPDGEPPIMVLGRNRRTGRPTALDADVVLHEYVHGVTTRLVGGLGNPSSLEAVQSAGLGEGWSDYFALTLQNHLHGTDRTRLGMWSTGRPQGLRHLAYDEDFPHDFGRLGTGRYDEPHAIGEIWAAALVQANRELVREVALGPGVDPTVTGNRLGWRIVLDGLRLTRSSPSLLDARDAILAAAEDIDASGGTGLVPGVRAADVLRRVFARFGMGRTARCHGPYLEGIVACHRY